MEDKVSLPADPSSQARVLVQVISNLEALFVQGNQAEILCSAIRGVKFVIESIKLNTETQAKDLLNGHSHIGDGACQS